MATTRRVANNGDEEGGPVACCVWFVILLAFLIPAIMYQSVFDAFDEGSKTTGLVIRTADTNAYGLCTNTAVGMVMEVLVGNETKQLTASHVSCVPTYRDHTEASAMVGTQQTIQRTGEEIILMADFHYLRDGATLLFVGAALWFVFGMFLMGARDVDSDGDDCDFDFDLS